MAKTVLVCVSRGISSPEGLDAVVKETVNGLKSLGAEVRIVLTQKVEKALDQKAWEGCEVFTDADEWNLWSGRGDPVMHIELRKWANMGVVIPADVGTVAKIASGQADDLLTCVMRAWEFHKQPLLFALEGDKYSLANPFTSAHSDTLAQLGIQVIPGAPNADGHTVADVSSALATLKNQLS